MTGFAVHYANDGSWTGDSFATKAEARAFVRAMNERNHWRYREPLTVRPINDACPWQPWPKAA